MKDVTILRGNGVNVNQALQFLGDIETYNEILNDFLLEIENRISQLKEFKTSNDMKNYSILIHTIKSDSKYLGFDRLAHVCFQHECESKNDNYQFINDNFYQLNEELQNTINISRKYLSS